MVAKATRTTGTTKNGTRKNAPSKRYGRSGAPIVVDLSDPKWADLRKQLADSTPASDEEVRAHLRWLEGDER
jgi:hypothetical protein